MYRQAAKKYIKNRDKSCLSQIYLIFLYFKTAEIWVLEVEQHTENTATALAGGAEDGILIMW
jgi:hypothetical protein